MYRKSLLTLLLSLSTAFAYSQKLFGYYNKLTEISGTPYFIANYDDVVKKGANAARINYLLFINTSTGEKTQIDFEKNAGLGRIEELKYDSLQIHRLLVTVWTGYDDKRFIDMRETPHYLTAFSVDGKEQVRLTKEGFYSQRWAVNSLTGALVITGYYDLNDNGKHDETDKNDILIYDLKTLKPIGN